jgi:hypothetical protein
MTLQSYASNVRLVSVSVSRQDILGIHCNYGYHRRCRELSDAIHISKHLLNNILQNLVGTQYSWVSSFFYVGFLVASPITSVALVKFSVVKVVAVTV